MNTLALSNQKVSVSKTELLNIALQRGEGKKSANGGIAVVTGKRTGRSPNDKFFVRDTFTEHSIDWGHINRPISPDVFHRLWHRAVNYLESKTEQHFADYHRVGADKNLGVVVHVVTEMAWHQLFAHHLFIAMDPNEPKPNPSDIWTILNVPGLSVDPKRDGTHSDGVVIINFSERKVLIAGMRYAGEMKKAMFTVLNFMLPQADVLPMHCAANADKDGHEVVLFFGLSGTGKTTLSSDNQRYLIGDDEHGWSAKGVFNFEGGCYAKCINLSKEREPVIWQAIRDEVIMENVVLNESLLPDFNDDSLTKNTRAAYPLEHIDQRISMGAGDVPHSVVFLTCDLYGVLPPVACLTKEQAAYYFLSGYTALVGSTEVGSSTDIQPTFSACFGAPFFPCEPSLYGKLLVKRLEETGASVYLVNTGWMGGAYGQGGQRFSIGTTRCVIRAIVNRSLKDIPTDVLPGFNLAIPKTVPGVADELLDPRIKWQNKDDYAQYANVLIGKFIKNFERFDTQDTINRAGPKQF